MTGSRRRGEALLQAIYAAALAEVAAVGFGGLTMDGIAVRADAARSSLYRRWHTPEAVLFDALNHAIPDGPDDTDHGDLRADLLAAFRQVCAVLDGPAGPTILALFGEQHRRPDLIAQFDHVVIRDRGELADAALRRAIARGELRAEVLDPPVSTAGLAQVFFHYLANASPPDPDELAAIIDQVVLPALYAR